MENSSAVERLAVNEDVAGSIPASPAISRQELIENTLCLIGFGLCTYALFAWGMV
jgi:hypothetical protein